MPQPHKQLKLHPLPGFRPCQDLTHHIGPGREIGLEAGLPQPFHVRQHRLQEMPVEKGVGGSAGVCEEGWITESEMGSGDVVDVGAEDDSVVVLARQNTMN